MPTPLTSEAIAELRQQYPWLRDDYFDYLSDVGWGETDAGPMIFEGPTDPDEIYGSRGHLSNVVLLGDDFQGYCFGYNSETKCYGEVSCDGLWEPWPSSVGIGRYVTELDSDAK